MYFEWEEISDELYSKTYRAKVIGGWLIRNIAWYEGSMSESMVFLPDPSHLWVD